MICPNCRAEYRDGYTRCAECGCALVEALPPEDAPRPDETPAFLCEAADEFEADLLIAKLGAEGIYAFKRFQGSDSYNKILLGRTVLGVLLFVGKSDLQEAREILGI